MTDREIELARAWLKLQAVLPAGSGAFAAFERLAKAAMASGIRSGFMGGCILTTIAAALLYWITR